MGKQMNERYGLMPGKNKWVTWGGSYPGMLAGWSRLHHPELIHASVASSAPVHGKLDMTEYNDAVANAYSVSDNDVGGSPACRDAIRAGHRQIEEMLREKGGSFLVEARLGISNGSLATKDGQRDLLGDGVAYFPSQGNDPACSEPACNIARICKVMTNTSHGDELSRLVAVRGAQALSQKPGYLKPKGPVLTNTPDFWYYQTCTEFGFYQSCEVGSNCMYVRGLVDVESMAAGCSRYGITVPEIASNIEATNKHYGGLRPTDATGELGSCVVWPNGEVDPWSYLSVLQSPAKDQPVLWVPGASHHAWTHPSAESDQASVVEARAHIREQVKSFLAHDCSAMAASLEPVIV